MILRDIFFVIFCLQQGHSFCSNEPPHPPIDIQRTIAKYPNRSELSFARQGILKQLLVDEGDRVCKDAVIAKLKDDEAIGRLQISRAKIVEKNAIDAAKVFASISEQAFQSVRKANQIVSLAFPKDEVRRREMEYERALYDLREEEQKYKVSVCEANLDEVILEEHNLRAPYSGLITRRFVSKGVPIDGFRPVYEIVDDSSIILDGFVTRDEARVIRLGEVVRVVSMVGATHGKLVFIDTSAQQITKLVRVRVELVPDSGIREGDDVKAIIDPRSEIAP